MRFARGAIILSSLAFIVVLGLSCKDDNPAGPGPGPGPTTVTINITGNSGASSFSPNPDTVSVGMAVRWHNSDGITHTSTANGGAWNTGNIQPGGTSAAITMNTASSFGYHCSIHPTMVGTLVVKP